MPLQKAQRWGSRSRPERKSEDGRGILAFSLRLRYYILKVKENAPVPQTDRLTMKKE